VNESENAIAWFDESGRIVFIIPWGSSLQLSLVGTTDVDHTAGPDDVKISAAETEYLLGVVRRLFPAAKYEKPISTFSSLRPLVRTSGGPATKASREHRIWTDEAGVVHVAGGKYTTYRAMSEEAANLLSNAPCVTAGTPLGGNTKQRIDELLARADEMSAQFRLTPQEIVHLIRSYGIQTPKVLEYLPASSAEGLTRVDSARIFFAVEHEMAQTLADVMYVSTYLGYEREWTPESLLPVEREIAQRLKT
jgi:glycerol-3-phosphate dehydrogenase